MAEACGLAGGRRSPSPWRSPTRRSSSRRRRRRRRTASSDDDDDREAGADQQRAAEPRGATPRAAAGRRSRGGRRARASRPRAGGRVLGRARRSARRGGVAAAAGGASRPARLAARRAAGSSGTARRRPELRAHGRAPRRGRRRGSRSSRRVRRRGFRPAGRAASRRSGRLVGGQLEVGRERGEAGVGAGPDGSSEIPAARRLRRRSALAGARAGRRRVGLAQGRRAAWRHAACSVPRLSMAQFPLKIDGLRRADWPRDPRRSDEEGRGAGTGPRRLKQPLGLVHGGVYASIAESLTSIATWKAVSAEGNARRGSRTRRASCARSCGGTIHAIARRRHRGRTTGVWEVDITDDEGRAVRARADDHRGASASRFGNTFLEAPSKRSSRWQSRPRQSAEGGGSQGRATRHENEAQLERGRGQEGRRRGDRGAGDRGEGDRQGGRPTAARPSPEPARPS